MANKERKKEKEKEEEEKKERKKKKKVLLFFTARSHTRKLAEKGADLSRLTTRTSTRPK